MIKTFCYSTHLHGFYEFSKSRSKFGRIIWFITVIIALLMTSYLVYDNTSEFFSEPVRIKINRTDPENVLYPSPKVCFIHWVSWVNWTKVHELNFTKHELLYAMSYLTDIHSLEIFDVEKVANSVKEKLRHNNMTLKQFYLTIALRKKVFYDIDNYNYSVELMAFNNPSVQNIFELDHTICYLFTEKEVANLIKEASKPGSNQSLEKGYEIKVDEKSLQFFEYENRNYKIKEEEMKILRSPLAERLEFDWMDYFPVYFYPDSANPSVVYLDSRVTPSIELTISVYLKKNSPERGQQCKEGQKSLIFNFTFVEDCLEKTRELIFRENNAYEDWIDYFNDISPKHIFFVYGNNTVIKNLNYTRHHKLENWFKSPEKIKEAYDRMTAYKLFNTSLETGCEVWDINFKESEIEDYQEPFVPISYPLPRQIVVREEIIMLTLSNFIAKVGGVLGIWTGASIITFLQLVHLLCGCVRGKKQRILPKNNRSQLETADLEPNGRSSLPTVPQTVRNIMPPGTLQPVLKHEPKNLCRRGLGKRSVAMTMPEIELSDQSSSVKVPRPPHPKRSRIGLNQ